MLKLSFAFFVIAVIAGAMGFAQMGSSAMLFARIMIVVFLLLAVISFMIGKLQAG